METIMELRFIDWLDLTLAITSSAILVLGIIKQEDKSQVAFTWILYVILDAITMFSTKEEGGWYVMQFGYAIGSLVMATILIYQKRFVWSWLETIITLLILTCLTLWQVYGSYWAVRSSILSEVSVGVYLVIRTYKNPVVKYNLIGYIGFLMTSVIAMFAAKDWSIEQMGFPFCETVLNVIIIIPLIVMWYKKKKVN